MRNLFLCLIALFLINCKSTIVVVKDIEKITVKNKSTENIEVCDNYEITKIVKTINNCYKEPYIFRAEYELTICYKNGTNIKILGNNNIIKINGVTYRTKRFGNVIGKYLEPYK